MTKINKVINIFNKLGGHIQKENLKYICRDFEYCTEPIKYDLYCKVCVKLKEKYDKKRNS